MIQEMYWQFYGFVYNKLESQLFLLFDYHKYDSLLENISGGKNDRRVD
jgi:hypothetical protein